MHELKDQQRIIGTLAKVTNSGNAIIVELECTELVLPHDPDLESQLQSLIGQEVVIKKSGSVYRVKELK